MKAVVHSQSCALFTSLRFVCDCGAINVNEKTASLSPTVVVEAGIQLDTDLAAEAAYLLSIYVQSDCPNWKEGVGSCGTCQQCRVTRCIDRLESLATTQNNKSSEASSNPELNQDGPASDTKSASSSLQQERDALAQGIVKAAVASAITDGSHSLTGPQLLLLCDDLIASTASLHTQVDALNKHIELAFKAASRTKAALILKVREKAKQHDDNCITLIMPSLTCNCPAVAFEQFADELEKVDLGDTKSNPG